MQRAYGSAIEGPHHTCIHSRACAGAFTNTHTPPPPQTHMHTRTNTFIRTSAPHTHTPSLKLKMENFREKKVLIRCLIILRPLPFLLLPLFVARSFALSLSSYLTPPLPLTPPFPIHIHLHLPSFPSSPPFPSCRSLFPSLLK